MGERERDVVALFGIAQPFVLAVVHLADDGSPVASGVELDTE